MFTDGFRQEDVDINITNQNVNSNMNDNMNMNFNQNQMGGMTMGDMMSPVIKAMFGSMCFLLRST